jgi:O-antigen/teichoic acid export membrane protein
VDASSARVRDGLGSVTRGTLYLLVATLVFVGLSFVSRVVTVRSISPAEWSAFSWSLTLAGLLSAFGTLGLPNAIARSIPFARTDAERRGMIRGALGIGAVAGVAVVGTLAVIGPMIGAALGDALIGEALQFFGVAVGASIVANLIASVFQGFEDVRPNALFVQVLNPLLFVVFLGVALFARDGLAYWEALLAYTAASVATLVVSAVYALRRLPRHLPAGPADRAALGRLLGFAAPLFVAGILGSLTGSGDTVILGLFSPLAVGDYTVSLTLARLLQVGISAASYIFLPVTTKFFRQGDTRSIQVTYTTVTKWMLLFSLPLFLVFFFLPSASLSFVYAGRYGVIIAPLQVLVVGAFASTLLGPGSACQVAFGQTRLVMYNSAAAAAADVGLAFLLVPLYGSVGAAVAWAAATVVAAGLSVVELAVLNGVHPFHGHALVPVLALGLPVGILLALFHARIPLLALPLLVLALAVGFLGSILATRSVDHGDELFLAAIEGLLGRPLPFVRRLGRLSRRRIGRR